MLVDETVEVVRTSARDGSYLHRHALRRLATMRLISDAPVRPDFAVDLDLLLFLPVPKDPSGATLKMFASPISKATLICGVPRAAECRPRVQSGQPSLSRAISRSPCNVNINRTDVWLSSSGREQTFATFPSGSPCCLMSFVSDAAESSSDTQRERGHIEKQDLPHASVKIP
jgi:hypothetical protein